MKLFPGQTRKKEAPALPGPEPRIPASLLADFNDSACGHMCRSSIFEKKLAEDISKLFWRKAVQMPAGQGWAVFEVTESVPDPAEPERVSWDNLPLAQGLTYFQAVENLAEFEHGLIQGSALEDWDGYAARPAPERVREVHVPHFYDLARLDGIIFDIKDGLPHPTLNGEIITKGTFAPPARTAHDQSVTTEAHDIAALAAIMNAKAPRRIDFKGLGQSYRNLDTMEDALLLMRAMQGLLQGEVLCGFEHKDFDDELFKHHSGLHIERYTKRVSSGRFDAFISIKKDQDTVLDSFDAPVYYTTRAKAQAYLKNICSYNLIWERTCAQFHDEIYKLDTADDEKSSILAVAGKIKCLRGLYRARHDLREIKNAPICKENGDKLQEIDDTITGIVRTACEFQLIDHDKNDQDYRALFDSFVANDHDVPETVWQALDNEIKDIELAQQKEKRRLKGALATMKMSPFSAPPIF